MEMRDRTREMWQASPEARRLCDKVYELEDQFDDMRMEVDSPIGYMIKCQSKPTDSDEWIDDEWIRPECLEYFNPSYFSFEVADCQSQGYLGSFNHNTQTLTIDPEYADNDATILHEMIHMHEFAYEDLPQYFHDMLFAGLYINLQKKIPELNEILINEAHLMNESGLYESGGLHDLLFLLKSFDLDIRNGYPLGTVFGYDKLDTFKKYSYIKE